MASLETGSKVPALTADWDGCVTTDPARIQLRWRAAPFNIGIVRGPLRLLVLDLDTPMPDTPPPGPAFDEDGVRDGVDALAMLCVQHAERLPFDTFTAATGRGGPHPYYRQDEHTALGGEPDELLAANARQWDSAGLSGTELDGRALSA